MKVVFAGRTDTTVWWRRSLPAHQSASGTSDETYTWTGTGGKKHLDSNTPAFRMVSRSRIILSVRRLHPYDTARLKCCPRPPSALAGQFLSGGDTITLAASSGFGDYQWSDTSTGEHVEITAGGLYSVTK